MSQKGESQNECYKNTKHAKSSKKKHVLPPDTHTRVFVSSGEKCLLFRKFVVLSFLFPFAILLTKLASKLT